MPSHVGFQGLGSELRGGLIPPPSLPSTFCCILQAVSPCETDSSLLRYGVCAPPLESRIDPVTILNNHAVVT